MVRGFRGWAGGSASSGNVWMTFLSASFSSLVHFSRYFSSSSWHWWGRSSCTRSSLSKKLKDGCHPVPHSRTSLIISSPLSRRRSPSSSSFRSDAYISTVSVMVSQKSAWLRSPPVPFCQNILLHVSKFMLQGVTEYIRCEGKKLLPVLEVWRRKSFLVCSVPDTLN